MSLPAFAALLERLVFTPGRNAKRALLRQWFATQPDPDRGVGLAALTGPQDELERMRVEFAARRDLIVSGLNAIEGFPTRTPDGAFYVFPHIRALCDRRYKGERIGGSVRLSEILLDEFQLAAVPGEPFGAEFYLRLSFATSREVINKGLERLRRFVGELE